MAEATRIAVTGARGVVGEFVRARLQRERVVVNAGYQPSKHSQPGQQGKGDGANEHWLPFTLNDADSAATLLEGCSGVVHCAFHHLPGRYRGGEGSDPQGFWQRNLGGTLTLLEACRTAGVERVVLLSSRAVFGESPAAASTATQPLADSAQTLPDTHYGALKQAEEALARQYAREHGMAVVALRPTGIYGARTQVKTSKWYDYVQAVQRGEPINETRAATEVHGDDLSDALWRLLRAPGPAVAGLAFNCSDQLISTCMLARELNRLTGQQLPLPAPDHYTSHPLQCTRLRELGWRPGGNQRLRQTLDQLLQHATKAGSSASD